MIICHSNDYILESRIDDQKIIMTLTIKQGKFKQFLYIYHVGDVGGTSLFPALPALPAGAASRTVVASRGTPAVSP